MANQKKPPWQVPKNGNTSGKRSQQFHHARANLRELMVAAMNDEIPPADGIVPILWCIYFRMRPKSGAQGPGLDADV